MSLEGTWIITQAWQGMKPYKFAADFAAGGTITVAGGYFGTWTVLGGSSQVSLAIAHCQNQTVTSYCGNVVGPAMGGQMTGASPSGKVFKGVWSAALQAHAEASEGALSLPE